MTLLAIRGLSVEIGGRRLLDDLQLEVAAGETLGLVGESGSGKSLTALAAMGLLPPGSRVSGSIRLNDQELVGADEGTLCTLRGKSAGIVFQEPATALNPLHTIGDQVAEAARLHEGLSRAAARARAAATLTRVGLDPTLIGLDRYPHELSGGQRQRVAIALAITLRPQLLIADEPTTALDVTTQAQIVVLLRELTQADGMGLVLVSHDLAVVAQIADRIAILRHGRLLETGTTARVLGSPAHPYTRELIAAFAPRPAREVPIASTRTPLLEAHALVRRYRVQRPQARTSEPLALDHVSLTIAPGERVGIVGESGSGKSTLVRTLLALETPDEGEVLINGRRLLGAPRASVRALRRLVQVVFQDPYASMNPRHRIGRIVAEPLYLAATPLTRAEQARRTAEALVDVGLEATDANRWPQEFSGGQRQRIALARALVIEPRLLILDEAVSALDASLRTQILELLAGLARSRELAYLFVSHDLTVVRSVTDRVLVMQAGRIVEEGLTADVLERPEQPYTRALVAATPNLTTALAASRHPRSFE